MTIPEKVAPGIYRVDALPIPGAIAVVLVASSDGWTLIDTGASPGAERIVAALNALGAEPGDLKRVYLTHHHADHIAGLPGVRAWAPTVEVIAPEYEAAILGGERAPDRSANAFLRFLNRRQEVPVTPVDRVVREGDEVAGLRVIATPGHTLGHTSLLSEEHGLLITGDAFGALFSGLRVGGMKAFCTDPAQAKCSALKLLDYDCSTVVLSHGPVLREGAKDQLRAATERCDWA